MKNILPVILVVAALECGRASTGSSTPSHDDDKQKVQAIFSIHDVVFAARVQPDAIVDAYRKLLRVGGSSLLERNRAFHRMLIDGVTVEHRNSKG